MMVGILLSYWEGLFSGVMLVSGGVPITLPWFTMEPSCCQCSRLPQHQSFQCNGLGGPWHLRHKVRRSWFPGGETQPGVQGFSTFEKATQTSMKLHELLMLESDSFQKKPWLSNDKTTVFLFFCGKKFPGIPRCAILAPFKAHHLLQCFSSIFKLTQCVDPWNCCLAANLRNEAAILQDLQISLIPWTQVKNDDNGRLRCASLVLGNGSKNSIPNRGFNGNLPWYKSKKTQQNTSK